MEELKKAEQVLESILQGITDPLLLLSKDLEILWTNKAFQDQTGYTLEEIIGNYCYKITHNSESRCQPPYDTCPVSEAERTGITATVTHTHFDKEGNKIFVEASAYPVMNEKGEITQFVCMYRDITEMKRAEEALINALEESRKHEAETLALLEGTRAVLESRDFDDAARSIFNSCKSLTGATAGYIALLSGDGTQSEVVFLDSGGLPCTVDPTLPMPIRGLREIGYRTGKTVYHNDFANSEFVKFLPEGHATLDSVLFAPLVIKGKVVGLLGLANKPGGFTEEDVRVASGFGELAAISLLNKRAEEDLRKAHDELERRVKERTAELIKANESLQAGIIERRRAEQALRESNELLRNIFSNIHVLIAHLDTNFNFIRVNKAYAEADGRDPEFFVGKNHFDLYPHEENEAIFRKVVETGEPVFFYEKPFEYATNPERGVTYWDWSLQPLKGVNGKIEGLILTLINRTRRYRAQEALIKSERKYRMLIEQASDGIAITDQQLNFTDVNYMFCKITGFTREELLRLNARNLLPAEDLVTNPLRLSEVLARETVVIERRLRRKDGTLVNVEVSAKMLDDGRIQTIVRDITERKKAEEELKYSREQLRNLSAHLQSVREEERTEFAREIHDELGQALTALKMDLFWLNKRLPKNKKSILEKTKSSSRLIDKTIKAVRRICTELRPEILDHLGLAAAVEWQVEEFKNRSGIKCDVFIEPEEIILNRDLSTTVFRIFQETLTNIARHAKATKVRVSVKEEKGMMILEVADNGIGITKKHISDPKSFGLMGIRERVHHWGGGVEIKGIRNKGTTVKVSIPLKKEEKIHD